MIQLTLPDEEIGKTTLRKISSSLIHVVQRKMEAPVSQKSQKYRHKEITKLLRITELTLLSYLQDYKAGGRGTQRTLPLLYFKAKSKKNIRKV
jgi:hypothetical protein